MRLRRRIFAPHSTTAEDKAPFHRQESHSGQKDNAASSLMGGDIPGTNRREFPACPCLGRRGRGSPTGSEGRGVGHGAVETARVLVAEGARSVAVSNLEEGLKPREAGLQGRILVMADCMSCGRAALVQSGLTPVVHSLQDLRELSRTAQAAERPLPYHIKIGSGLGRLGLRPCAADILAAIGEARNLVLEGLMTHFASAADYRSTQTEDQIAVFENVVGKLRRAGVLPSYVHLSNSNAIAHGRRSRFENAVRPGLAIYGYLTPARGEAQPPLLRVMPALCWKAPVLAVKEVPEGAAISYGAMFRTTRPSRIAILGVGYADGYPHQLSNGGHVIAGGRLAPIVGAVSMDLTTIDVSQSPRLQPGDAVTLLGREGDLVLDAMRIACTAGMIPYNVLCAINPRVKRVYGD